MAMGRPAHYETAEQLQAAIERYFESTPDRPTMSGLAVFLGFCDRQSMYDYQNRSEDFSCTIKAAISRIEAIHEQRLMDGQCAGSIFWLKNRGWRDHTDLNHSGAVETKKADLSKLTEEELRLLIKLQEKIKGD